MKRLGAPGQPPCWRCDHLQRTAVGQGQSASPPRSMHAFGTMRARMLERIRKFALLTTMEREKYSASRTNTHAWLRARTCSHDSCAQAHGQTDARVQYSLHKPTLFSCSDTRLPTQTNSELCGMPMRMCMPPHGTARHGAIFVGLFARTRPSVFRSHAPSLARRRWSQRECLHSDALCCRQPTPTNLIL